MIFYKFFAAYFSTAFQKKKPEQSYGSNAFSSYIHVIDIILETSEHVKCVSIFLGLHIRAIYLAAHSYIHYTVVEYRKHNV